MTTQTKVQHHPEPWFLNELADGEGIQILTAEPYENGTLSQWWSPLVCLVDESPTFDKANARRIVATVNACAGIPTEELEAGSIRSLQSIYNALGWQGGTIHQVVRRIESLVRLEKEVGSEALAKLEGRA